MSNARNGLTRRRLIANAAAAGILADAGIRAAQARMPPRRMGAPQGGGTTPPPPPGQIVTAGFVNQTASAAVNPTVQFYQTIAEGDLVDGQTVVVTDKTSATVPYTAARRSKWKHAPTKFNGLDLFCRPTITLPAKRGLTGITISGTTATATSSGAHGLANGDEVLIQAVDDLYVDSPNVYYYGFAPVTVTGTTTFTYTVIGIVPPGPSTVAMEMCYGSRLTISSATGSFNDTLPAGKTSAAILADYIANHDNVTLDLVGFRRIAAGTGWGDAAGLAPAGTNEGSGLYTASLATAIAQAGTDQLRVVATGPTLLDVVGIMLFADNSGGARHATVAARFYASFVLDPSSGAIVDIHARGFVDQSLCTGPTATDYFFCQVRQKLGGTVVRSWGLSTNNAVDGKLQNFAPSAVNTGTNAINVPNHGFGGDERVIFSSSGSLPSGLSSANSYYIIYVDRSNIKLGTWAQDGNQMGIADAVALGTQGSGTHTVTCIQQIPPFTRQPVIDLSGNPDRWVGQTGALKPWQIHIVHDRAYGQKSRITPAVDFSENFSSPVAVLRPGFVGGGSAIKTNTKARYVWGSCGALQIGMDQGGGGVSHTYGTAWASYALAHAALPHEIGMAQMHLNSAWALTSWNTYFTDGTATWRPVVCNNGPNRAGASYSGMPAPRPTIWLLWANEVYENGAVFPTNVLTNPSHQDGFSESHRYHYYMSAYSFFGREELHDAMIADATDIAISHNNGTYTTPPGYPLCRHHVIGGINYYGISLNGGGQNDRAQSAQVLSVIGAHVLCSATAPEAPMLKDYIEDTIAIYNNLCLTQAAIYDPDWLDQGGFETGVLTNGVGVSDDFNNDGSELFVANIFYCQMAYCYMICPTPTFKNVTRHILKYTYNLYANVANSWRSNEYFTRTMVGQGTSVANAGKHVPFSQWISGPIFRDINVGAVVCMPDGTLRADQLDTMQPYFFPAAGQAHCITYSGGSGENGYYKVVPPELTLYGIYYPRQGNGTYSGWKYATTMSDSTIISSYSVSGPSGHIVTNMNTSTTSITTDIELTGMMGLFVSGINTSPVYDRSFIVITSGAGVEVCAVNSHGQKTSGLEKNYTIFRGSCGTTALNHGANASVSTPFVCTYFHDAENYAMAAPPTGHGFRANQSANVPEFGYRTQQRQTLGFGYLANLFPRDGFDSCNVWWSDSTTTGGGSAGPGSFGNTGNISYSVDMTLPRLPY